VALWQRRRDPDAEGVEGWEWGEGIPGRRVIPEIDMAADQIGSNTIIIIIIEIVHEVQL